MEMNDDFNYDELVRRTLMNLGTFILGVLICAMIGAIMGSCRSVRYVSVPEYHEVVKVRTDSVLKHDSIWVHDSVSVLMRGDTIYHDRWHTKTAYKYLYKTKSDTIMRTDSVRVPYPVERKLGWWEQKKQDYFVPLLVVCGVFFVSLWWIMRRCRNTI